MMSGVPLETCWAFNKLAIINSITKLHLIGISTESSTMHGSMNIKWIILLIDLVYVAQTVSVSNISKPYHVWYDISKVMLSHGKMWYFEQEHFHVREGMAMFLADSSSYWVANNRGGNNSEPVFNSASGYSKNAADRKECVFWHQYT
jgi:hypothetical protein